MRIRAKAKLQSWAGDALLDKIGVVLQAYGEKVSPQLQESIKSRAYDWPTPTLRKEGLYSGRFVPKGKRDIVDTGKLLQSQTAPQVADNVMTIRWTEPYSKAVLEGGFLIGTVRNAYIAPGRDWITPVLQYTPPARFFAEEWKRLGR